MPVAGGAGFVLGEAGALLAPAPALFVPGAGAVASVAGGAGLLVPGTVVVPLDVSVPVPVELVPVMFDGEVVVVELLVACSSVTGLFVVYVPVVELPRLFCVSAQPTTQAEVNRAATNNVVFITILPLHLVETANAKAHADCKCQANGVSSANSALVYSLRPDRLSQKKPTLGEA